jgi:hypothetical protein
MRRIGVIVALGALLTALGGVVTAAPALAVGGRGDGWVYQNFGQPPPTTDCGFQINLTQDVDNVFGKALTAPDGSMIMLFTGAAKVTFTNPANGKSVSANTSAAGKIVVSPDGTTTTFRSMGPTPIDLTPDDAARLGVPAVFVFAGNGTATLDAAGNIISGSMNGQILVNVCAVLS